MAPTEVNGTATVANGHPTPNPSDFRETTDASNDSTAPRRDAILYVPGLIGNDDEFETIAGKLAEALTTFGSDVSNRYHYEEMTLQLKSDDSAPSTAFAVINDSGGAATRGFDLFRLDYEANVVGEYTNAQILSKALQLVLTLRWLAPLIWQTAEFGYRKTESQRNQLRYAVVILLGVALYFILTFVAIIQVGIATLTPHKAKFDLSAAASHFSSWFAHLCPPLAFLVGAAARKPSAWQRPHDVSFIMTAADAASYGWQLFRFAFETAYHWTIALGGGWLISNAPIIALLFTAIGFATPKLRKNFENFMNHMLAAIEYFRIGFARNVTTGQFFDLYDDLCKATERYTSVHVMGYGFGALVALDALFYTRGVAQKRIDRLGALITIGAPITMAQRFCPKHFDVIRSRFSGSAPHTWINAQCALDVVASPILDRNGTTGKFEEWDTSLSPEQQLAPSPWEIARRKEFKRQQKAVERDNGDPNNINFSRATNLDYSGWYPLDLSWPEFFSLAALRAHTMYWSSRARTDYNVFDRIAPELEAVSVQASVQARISR